MNTQDDDAPAGPAPRRDQPARRPPHGCGRGSEPHSSSSPPRAAARAAQRAPLAHLLPPGLAGAWCWPLPGRLIVAAHAQTAPSGAAHRAGRSARRDRRRSRGQRRDAGGCAEERLRGRRRAGRGAAHQLARRQPGAGRHHQRRDPPPEGASTRRRSMPWSRRSAPRAPTTSPWRPTRSTSTRPASSARIGVLMDGFGFTGLMDKLGVERRLLTAGENKGMLDPFSPQNREAAAPMPRPCSTRSTSSSSRWCARAAASA